MEWDWMGIGWAELLDINSIDQSIVETCPPPPFRKVLSSVSRLSNSSCMLSIILSEVIFGDGSPLWRRHTIVLRLELQMAPVHLHIQTVTAVLSLAMPSRPSVIHGIVRREYRNASWP